jgi:hypothetical protein
VSAIEWRASAIMPEDPVIMAAPSFKTEIKALAKSAPNTASINVSFGYELIAPLGLSRKSRTVAMAFRL